MITASVLAVSVLIGGAALAPSPDQGTGGYAVVVAASTVSSNGWADVVGALRKKHNGFVVVCQGDDLADALPELRRRHPRYTCFVAEHQRVTREFVTSVHRMTRQLDADPYADTMWGILTGFDAANALAIARHDAPLSVRKVASGTEVALDMCEEGLCYDELVKNKAVRKKPGGKPLQERGPDDTTQALVDTLNSYKADLFVTSGHATERDWQIGYRYRNGSFRSKAGQMFGRDTQGTRIEINSPNPKVYLPIGNCLMGHINGPDAMALAWMNDVGVRQMVGYIQPTWYGYSGWGCLDYFLEQPGRYTFAEAFHANQHALVHRLTTYFPDVATNDFQTIRRAPVAVPERAKTAGLSAHDARGLLFDRDVVVLYGDPAWSARMAPAANAYEQTLTVTGGVHTLSIRPNRGGESFTPVNTNGSQRGWRPIIAFLPRRVTGVTVVEGAEWSPTVTDDFILVPRPRGKVPAEGIQIVFKGTP